MTVICSKCGNEVRPGARFCGSCGSPIEELQPAAPVIEEHTTCPHCGKPIRKDAKFCPSCGLSIPAAAEAAPTPVPSEPPPGAPVPPPPPSSAVSMEAPPPKRSAFGRYWWLILLVIIFCLASIGLVWFLANRGIIEIPILTPATETPAPTQTELPPPTSTHTLEPTFTLTHTPTQTPTNTPEPTPTIELPTPTIPVEETAPVVPTATQEPTSTPEPEIIFRDDFTTPLTGNWETWGAPPDPVIEGAGRNRALNLDTALRAGGVTSLDNFSVSPVFEISFDAALIELSPDHSLAFDWYEDANGIEPGKEGQIQILINQDQAEMVIFRPDPNCSSPINDTDFHTYRIRFESPSNAIFFIDDDQICTLKNEGFRIATGYLTFSGRGWIDDVIITQYK